LPENNKNKKIGIWICSALVIGNMIGSGIFLLPASLASYGGVSIIGWLATTFGALMTALVFVRLSRRFPRQGGPYRYAYDHFGSFAAFSVTWSYWISIWVTNAAIAVAAITYLSFFWPSLQESTLYSALLALAFIWLTTLMNMKGVREAGIFQLVTTVIKFVPLLIIGAMCVTEFNVESFKPFNLSGEPLFTSITATAALTLWAFLGLESATIPADNVENPSRTIPRATIIGIVATAIVYVSTTVTIMSVIPNGQLQTSSAPFADAAQVLWGSWGGVAIAIVAVASCLGALNGWILLQGQVPMSAARDGLMPKVFIDKKGDGVSSGALIISSILSTILVLANFNEGMVQLFTFAILLATLGVFIPYLLSIAADIKLIIKHWKVHQDYFSLITAILAFIYCCWAISGIGSNVILWGIALMAAGIPIYLYRIHKIKLKKLSQQTESIESVRKQ
jgi:APA family basic amino acid/polyamine antiporter